MGVGRSGRGPAELRGVAPLVFTVGVACNALLDNDRRELAPDLTLPGDAGALGEVSREIAGGAAGEAGGRANGAAGDEDGGTTGSTGGLGGAESGADAGGAGGAEGGAPAGGARGAEDARAGSGTGGKGSAGSGGAAPLRECEPGENSPLESVNCSCGGSKTRGKTCSSDGTWGPLVDKSACDLECCSVVVYCDAHKAGFSNIGTWCRADSRCTREEALTDCDQDIAVPDLCGGNKVEPFYMEY